MKNIRIKPLPPSHTRRIREKRLQRRADEQGKIRKLIEENEALEKENFGRVLHSLKRIAWVLIPLWFVGTETINYLTGVVWDKFGANKIFENFSLIEAKSNNHIIFSSNGQSSYTGNSNAIATNMNKIAHIPGFGYYMPTAGSLENIALISDPTNFSNIAFAQGDAALFARHVMGNDNFVVLRELPNAPECAFTISQKFEYYADLEEATEKAAQTETRDDDIKIGISSPLTGSFVTTMAIASPLNPDGYRFVDFNSLETMITATNDEEVDVSCFVQMPGFVGDKFVGGLAIIDKNDVSIMEMDEESFDKYFAGHPFGYRRLETKIDPVFKALRSSAWQAQWRGSQKFPALLATNTTVIGHNIHEPQTSPGALNAGFASVVHQAITSTLKPEDMVPSNLPKITALNDNSDFEITAAMNGSGDNIQNAFAATVQNWMQTMIHGPEENLNPDPLHPPEPATP